MRFHPMVTDARLNEYAAVTTLIARCARARDDVVAAAVVGSWARGAARMDSDIDIVVLTNEKPATSMMTTGSRWH
jgi:predicted nucleotidyltransferase